MAYWNVQYPYKQDKSTSIAETKALLNYETNSRGQKVISTSYLRKEKPTKTPNLSTLKELRSYINTDIWMWDFDYVESLIDKMNDRELKIFAETGKLMMVES